MVLAEKRRPAVESNGLSMKLGARHRDSPWQSCTDEAEAAVLATLNEGVRGFHAFNPNHWGEGWQAGEKN
jgi:hypothetical protein